ncbi:unnamed protein product [Caretta caretta]
MGQQLWRIGIIGTPLGEMGNNTGTMEQLWAEFGDRQGTAPGLGEEAGARGEPRGRGIGRAAAEERSAAGERLLRSDEGRTVL